MLREKILSKKSGILTYGITPPKQIHELEKITEIAHKQMDRISQIDIDGLIVYDVQEETDRLEQERPFPYIKTVDPSVYSNDFLSRMNVPKIVYRCVGKYTENQLAEWITSDLEHDRFSVYVGASSSKQEVRMGLSDSFELSKKLNDKLILGGVVIPERHLKNNDEHLRMISKIRNGCKFFVTQAVYNVEASKNFLSDYYYYSQKNDLDMVPILFNIAPCGSLKTLEFMKWLGISLPKWLENDLIHSNDILDKSVSLSTLLFEELLDYGLEKGIPIGCSVESVSTRKVEIEASIQLAKDIKSMIDKKLLPART